jgi:uncharacterized protein YgbK (DUF1537 family)
VYDVPVLTRWSEEVLRSELERPDPCFYILTNARSLPAAGARSLNLEIARNLRRAADQVGREFSVVSRSDSTLRGHFPLETDSLADVLGPFDATFLIPYFEAGGRYTIHDVHYVADGEQLLPAAETAFAGDAAFGYRNSHLGQWVEEKSQGRISASQVYSIDVPVLRGAHLDDGWPRDVTTWLQQLPSGSVCVVNACHPNDIEVFALAALRAEQDGSTFVYRTAADFVAARLGLKPRPLWRPSAAADARSSSGGLVVVGSHVPKSSEQLSRLLRDESLTSVEVRVPRLLSEATGENEVDAACAAVEASLRGGMSTVVFTSRNVITGESAEASLRIGECVSAALVEIVRRLDVRPRFLVAKGGITSSDLATRGLQVRRAMVVGQILPGVPVWDLGSEARFPGMPYLVFPGNVGGPDSLAQVVQILSRAGC